VRDGGVFDLFIDGRSGVVVRLGTYLPVNPAFIRQSNSLYYQPHEACLRRYTHRWWMFLGLSNHLI